MQVKHAAVAAILFVGHAAFAHAQVEMNMNDGRITLQARDASVRQILAEWGRVGQTRIVNGERVFGTPITIDLVDVPEKQALDILLRSVSGYLATPRASLPAHVSRFDRILVLPGTPQPRSTTSAVTPPLPPAARPVPFTADDVDLSGLPPQPQRPATAPPPPAPPLAPPPPPVPAAAAPPPTTPSGGVGTSAPGMMPPTQTTSPGAAPVRR